MLYNTCVKCGDEFTSRQEDGYRMFCSESCERNWLNSEADWATVTPTTGDYPPRMPAQATPVLR